VTHYQMPRDQSLTSHQPGHLCTAHPHRILQVGHRNRGRVLGFNEGMKERFGLRILVVATFLASASTAWAALGQPAASVENDRANMRGKLEVLQGQGFTIHQITAPTGVVVKEYVSPSGTVFGVSWRGPVTPDLSRLLGSYAAQFQRAASMRASYPRRHIMVHTAELVAETGGHMRDLRGFAYVPSLLPAGVTAASIE
jgi:uncharacterized protein DUF2844